MLNPKEAENFYNQSMPEFLANNSGFSPNSILDNPSEELDGIEVLVQMAKKGDIDPWRIDIADIADKYMLHIAQSKSNNLRVTGRALFFLAVLLKMKSNVLVGLDPREFDIVGAGDEPDGITDDPIIDPDVYEQYYYPDNVIPIEDVIQRRTSVKLNRNRIVTLKDLIRQLEFYEQLDRKQAVQNSLERAKRRVRNYANMSAEDIINLAHEEYIESSVKILHENLVKIFEKEEKVELNTLTLLGIDRVSAYMALLFLSVDSEFDLEQEEFYSDLYVVKKQPSVEQTDEQSA